MQFRIERLPGVRRLVGALLPRGARRSLALRTRQKRPQVGALQGGALKHQMKLLLTILFLLLAVLWANSPPTSVKRWFKEFGNIAVLLVVHTEARPQQALRAVVLRIVCDGRQPNRLAQSGLPQHPLQAAEKHV